MPWLWMWVTITSSDTPARVMPMTSATVTAPGAGRPSAGRDLGPIAGFDVIQAAADRRAAERTHAGADGRSRAGVAHRVADDRSHPRTAQSAGQRP